MDKPDLIDVGLDSKLTNIWLPNIATDKTSQTMARQGADTDNRGPPCKNRTWAHCYPSRYRALLMSI